jgi:putative ABC transport system permease protein
MLRVTFRSFWAHKRRLVSTVVSIVLGVAFMSGTFVLSDTIGRVFDDLFADVGEPIDAQVQGEVLFTDPFGGGDERREIESGLLDVLREVDGVVGVEPYINLAGFGSVNRVLGEDGEPIGVSQGPPTILENWVIDDRLNPYVIDTGRPPESDGEIALNVAAARDAEKTVGDEVVVVTQEGRSTFELVGIFRFGTAESVAGTVTANFTLPDIQRIAGLTGFQYLYVAGEDGATEQEVVDAIAPSVPEGFEVLTGEAAAAQLSSEVQGGFQFFSLALLIFGAIALLVGVFVISNTFSILVAQRTRELALLRAVGASRSQVLRSVMVEALLVGLLAAALGLLVGIGLAQGVFSLLAASGGDLPTTTLAIRWFTIVFAFVIGLGVTLVAASVPAIRATRVPPLAALREVAIDRSGASKVRVAGGVLVLIAGAFLLSSAWTADGDTDAIPTVGVGALLIIIGAIVVGPILADPSIRLVGRPLRRLRGVTGRLATENAARSPKRTAATVSALLIGVALVSFITVFAASASRSVESEVARGFVGDFVIQSEMTAFGPFSGFPAEVSTLAAEVDGVALVTSFGFTPARITYPDGSTADTPVFSFEPESATAVIDPRMAEGEVTDLTDEGVLVDRQIASRNDLAVGDTVTMTVPGGRAIELRVDGLADDQTLLGSFSITRDTFLEVVPEKIDIQAIGLLDEGADLQKVLADLEEATSDTPALDVLDKDGFVASITSQITSFVTVIYGLLILSIIIALIGIANTLSLSINERTRELGLLRAVGMDRRQVRSTIYWEAVLMAVLGTLVGIGLGIGLSFALVKSLSGFGLSQFALPIAPIVVIIVAATLLGTLASIRPARRAAKLAILDAIATE